MNGATAVAVALSLVSAVAYASAAVAQERLAARTEPGTGVLTLLTRGAWWWAVGLNAAGALLHVVALTYGPLTVVQPLGALTLVAAVPLGARRAGRQVSRGEWRGTAFTLVGLAAILLTAAGSSPDETLSLPQALGVAGVALALVALLTRPGAGSGLRHAAASGITSGVASALTQTVTVAATARDADALPIWQVAAVALVVATFASGGLLLSQRAYRGGLGAPLAVLTLANPLAAAVIGLTLLGERLQGGALGVTAALLGAVLAARGVVLLTRTAVAAPAMPGAMAEVPMAQLPGQRSAVRAAMSPTRPDLGGHTMESAAMESAAMEPAAMGPGVGVPAQGAPARDPFAARPSWRPHPLRSRRALRERRRARRRGDCTYR
ncbi:hypothetical protein [Streptomyces scopuliridis]|uniref:hypothetical protein n=1 Tax=Streptomyces scopuliridis TaxID=452529 RepID=UPI003680E7AD